MAVGVLVCAPSWVAAQSKPKPTKLQRELYSRAFQAYRMNRFDDAVTFLSAANSLQAFDLLHYSAGRA